MLRAEQRIFIMNFEAAKRMQSGNRTFNYQRAFFKPLP